MHLLMRLLAYPLSRVCTPHTSTEPRYKVSTAALKRKSLSRTWGHSLSGCMPSGDPQSIPPLHPIYGQAAYLGLPSQRRHGEPLKSCRLERPLHASDAPPAPTKHEVHQVPAKRFTQPVSMLAALIGLYASAKTGDALILLSQK